MPASQERSLEVPARVVQPQSPPKYTGWVSLVRKSEIQNDLKFEALWAPTWWNKWKIPQLTSRIELQSKHRCAKILFKTTFKLCVCLSHYNKHLGESAQREKRFLWTHSSGAFSLWSLDLLALDQWWHIMVEMRVEEQTVPPTGKEMKK
jgi:hypothetical protein